MLPLSQPISFLYSFWFVRLLYHVIHCLSSGVFSIVSMKSNSFLINLGSAYLIWIGSKSNASHVLSTNHSIGAHSLYDHQYDNSVILYGTVI